MGLPSPRRWTKLLETYPDSALVTSARGKLDLLAQMTGTAAVEAKKTYPPNTLLVLPDEDYAWAHVEIAAALGNLAVPTDEKLSTAVKLAAADTNITGIVQVDLSVDVPFESGRVVCYQRSGVKAWQKVVRMTYPGSAEAIAHRFTDRLAKEVKGGARRVPDWMSRDRALPVHVVREALRASDPI